jgi:LacI family transcriptional regulator
MDVRSGKAYMPQDQGAVAAVTIHVVARKAGVSTATVSRVLRGSASASDITRAKVVAAAREVGYRTPTRSRSSTAVRHGAHGLVLSDLGHPHYHDLLMGIESAAADLGQSLVLLVSRRRPDAVEAVRELSKRVDGMVLGANTVADSVAHSLSSVLPVVLLARSDVAGCDSVRVDNQENAALLTSHLFEHGRSHLVFVGDPDESHNVSERYAGFRRAHAAAGVPVRRPPLRVPLIEGAGAEVAEEIMRRRVKIDGLVCGNDDLALGIMKRLHRNGVSIPNDLAVVGWDDVPAARFIIPGLTTVRQPMRELGRLAVAQLHARVVDGQSARGPRVLPTQLVLRSSCGCPALLPSAGARPPR